MLLLGALIGCAGTKPIVIQAIRGTDFYVTDAGDTGEVVMSKWYFNNVLKIELDNTR